MLRESKTFENSLKDRMTNLISLSQQKASEKIAVNYIQESLR